MDEKQFRQRRLRELIDRTTGGNAAEFARKVNRSPQQIIDMRAGRKSFGEKISRDFEKTLELPVGYFDAHRSAQLPAPAAQSRVAPPIEHGITVDGVELTRGALEVAKAWMDLPRNKREEFKRQIETLALQYADPVPDAVMESFGREKKAKN